MWDWRWRPRILSSLNGDSMSHSAGHDPRGEEVRRRDYRGQFSRRRISAGIRNITGAYVHYHECRRKGFPLSAARRTGKPSPISPVSFVFADKWMGLLTFFVFVHAFLQGRVVHFGLGGRVGRAGTSLGTATRAAAGARVSWVVGHVQQVQIAVLQHKTHTLKKFDY